MDAWSIVNWVEEGANPREVKIKGFLCRIPGQITDLGHRVELLLVQIEMSESRWFGHRGL